MRRPVRRIERLRIFCPALPKQHQEELQTELRNAGRVFANRIFEIRNRNVERNRAATQRQAPASNGGANVQPSRGNVRPVQARVDYKQTSAYVEMRERYSQKLRYLLGLQQHYAASGNAYGVNRSQARIADLEKKFRLESIALAAVNQ